jgi:hypothetical protein
MKLILGVRPSAYTDLLGVDYKQDPTVQQVAHGIEKKYGLMGKFVEMHPQLVGDAVAELLVQKLEGKNINDKSVKKIATAFKDDLQLKQFDGKIKGVATKAARMGRKWRKNSPDRGTNRPSFIDTGTYKAAMDAVIEDA